MRVQLEQTPQKSGRPSVSRGIKAIHGSGHHQRQGVLSSALRPSQNHGMGKPVAGQHLPQLAEGLRIALKVRKWHAAILNMKVEVVSGGFPAFIAI